MWNCGHVEESLSLYFDGLLSEVDRQEVELHVSSCRSCFEEFETMREAVDSLRALSAIPAPERLLARILDPGHFAAESCSRVEADLGELIAQEHGEPADLDALSRARLLGHLEACESCRGLRDAISDGVVWAGDFPEYAAPPALMARILAETSRSAGQDASDGAGVGSPAVGPVAVRETWGDTLRDVAWWLLEPRTAMMALTAVLVLGWMSAMAGVRPDIRTLSSPAALYDSVQMIADEVYDEGVRFYYAVPYAFVGEVQARIEQMRGESS